MFRLDDKLLVSSLRSCKCLGEIKVLDKEFDGDFMKPGIPDGEPSYEPR